VAGNQDIPNLPAPGGIPAGLGQLDQDSSLYVLHNVHICICHPLPVCLQLAMANWSRNCLSGMSWTNNLSPEMACEGSVYSEHPAVDVVYEDSLLALLLVIAFGFAFYMLLFDPDEMVSDINGTHLNFKLVLIIEF